jgi:diaminopimelate epimerase
MALSFAKMEGAGNDFVVLAGELEPLEVPTELVAALCDRRTGIGADGLVEMQRLHTDVEEAFRVRCFNADGSPVFTCLNAFRCAALRAAELAWVDQEFTFQTDRGTVEARSDGDLVEVGFEPPELRSRRVALPAGAPSAQASLVSLGDPHLVVLLDAETLTGIDFAAVARPLRHWTGASPAGANVHFAAPSGERVAIRSFERGVEGETMACGSGCVAAACVLDDDMAGPSRIDFRTAGGHVLIVSTGGLRWSIAGPARTVFTGEWAPTRHLIPLAG